MDNDLASKILASAKSAAPADEEPEAADDGPEELDEGYLDAHYGSVARELIDAVQGGDLESVKNILRMLTKE